MLGLKLKLFLLPRLFRWQKILKVKNSLRGKIQVTVRKTQSKTEAKDISSKTKTLDTLKVMLHRPFQKDKRFSKDLKGVPLTFSLLNNTASKNVKGKSPR